MCTHLSAWITASQGYFGIVEPGRQSNTMVKTNQAIAGTKRLKDTGKELMKTKNTEINQLFRPHTSGQDAARCFRLLVRG